MKRSIYRILVLLPVLMAAATISRAERGDTLINPYFKIINIISNLTSGTLYTANVASYFEHVDSVGAHTYDSAFTTITFAGDKYQTLVDSVETVQDDLYNLTIDNRDSLIIIAPPRHVYTVLFREDILDSTFQQNYLDSIYI